jgi:hypothetical protein
MPDSRIDPGPVLHLDGNRVTQELLVADTIEEPFLPVALSPPLLFNRRLYRFYR